MTLLDQIKKKAEEIYPLIVEHRRYLHRFPELSFQEHCTVAFIRDCLYKAGIDPQPIGDTGLLARIEGGLPGDKLVLLRADIDALPIHELRQTEYTSANPGVMHACGHDAHTASLIGVAMILHSIRDSFAGTVKLLFQPAEEILPGGACQMIREGVLEEPGLIGVIGQHVMPALPAGRIALRKGRFMASKDDLHITVNGRGGHGAQPQENVDPVVIAAHIVIALQQLVSRFSHPATPSVLSIGRFLANGAINVIPDKVEMQGAFRTMDENWRYDAHAKMRKMAIGIAESMGGTCEFRIETGYPFLVNADDLTDNVAVFAGEYLGENNIEEAAIWMASEDFAYYSQQTDACFYLLGTGNESAGIKASLHSPDFDIDESALLLSTGLMAYVALRQLGNNT
ncbi:M20 family metallopeptidase [Terrimonas sp. NA20]|uniref:M20 family metallopeptidase n=1 Tax=Terrimonas ginsenosidimutans TaxID=2908004 RepID=A0ABS9KT28_9BACT|nr:M20 family metallopeptidase [Terrimonas ginsenosidimutans]